METFKTSFGDIIQVDPEVENILYKNIVTAINCHEKCTIYDPETNKKLKFSTKVGVTQKIHGDLYTFAILMDFMEANGLLTKQYKRCLDIGGREGVHAALFRGLYAERAEVADLHDGRDPQLTEKLTTSLKQFNRWRWVDYLYGLPIIRQREYEMLKCRVTRLGARRFQPVASRKHFYLNKFNRKPNVDEFLLGDWREIEDKKYDIILSFNSFYLWDYADALKKVHDLLEDGGIFAGVIPYAWDQHSTFGLSGGFPFFEQRLTLEDIKKYYLKFKPEDVSVVDQVYYSIDPKRASLANYVSYSSEIGLPLIACTRLSRWGNVNQLHYNTSRNFTYSHPRLSNKVNVDFQDILKNIQKFRSDIHIEDLMTHAFLMVFKKV